MKITVNIKGRELVIGNISDNRFYKSVMKSKHLMRNLNAWGVDAEALYDVIKPNANSIIVYDKENNVVYETTTQKFIDFGVEKDFGFGKQTFLPLKYWNMTDREKTIPAVAEQLELL